MKIHYLHCDCHVPYHVLTAYTYSDEHSNDDMMEISFVSVRNGSFWHRVKYALLHILNKDILVEADIVVSKAELLKFVEDVNNG